MRLYRERVLAGDMTEDEAAAMLCGKSPFEAQGRLAAFVPTPTVNDAKNSTFPPSLRRRDSLVGHIMRTGFVSTPTATRRGSYKHGRPVAGMKGGCRNLSEDVAALGSRGELNPPWVEWLQGFPIGWTDLGDSETPSSPRSPSGSAGG